MLIGTMNHPGRDLIQEIRSIAEMGFDFIDLTLEPPRATATSIDVTNVKRVLEDCHLQVVGHTAYYLPISSPFETLRRAAIDELRVCIEVFAMLGATWMNLHPDGQAPFQERRFVIEQNLRSIRELLPSAQELGIGLMIENIPGSFNSAAQLAELLDPIPQLALHLDVGHSNLLTERNTADDLISTYSARLKHVHMHDNKGGSADLHLPLGAGNIDSRHYVRSLIQGGYDGPITLEVFTPDRQLLAYSKDVLRRLWDESVSDARLNRPVRQPAWSK